MNSVNRKSYILIGASLGLLVIAFVIFAGLSNTTTKVQASNLNTPNELVLYDYESGIEGWVGNLIANDPGGTVEVTTTHATHGAQALQLNAIPGGDTSGGFFSVDPASPLDFSLYTYFKFDVYTPLTATVVVAFQTGGGWSWQQSPGTVLTPGDNNVTINLLSDFSGPLPNADIIQQIHIYYSESPATFVQDYVRLEGELPTPTPTLTWTPILETPTPPAELPGFRVYGRHIYDYCGEQVNLRGVNKMVIWTDLDGIPAFHEIAKTGANVVRIVWLTTGSAAELDTAITNAIDNHLIPMVGLWDHTGNWPGLQELVSYWTRPDIVSVIQKHEQYLLVNIGNEVGDAAVTEEQFKEGYRLAILRMRIAGIHTPLVIDGSDWGKSIDMLQATGPYLQSIDPDHNLIFDVHMYWPYYWGWTDQRVVDEIAESVQIGIPLIVGEFGNMWEDVPGGEIPWRTIMEQTYWNDVGMIPWEWGPGNNPQTWLNMTQDGMYDTLFGWGLEIAVTGTYSILNTTDRLYSVVNGTCEGAPPTPYPSPTPYNILPEVAITSPEFDSMFDSGESFDVGISATDEDGTIEKVEIFANGIKAGEAISAPYTVTLSLPMGEYMLTAVATDNNGETAVSKADHVIVRLPLYFSINDGTIGNEVYHFTYTGSWQVGFKEGRFHDDDHYSYAVDDVAEFLFTGTKIALFGAKAPHHGIAGVSVDGGPEVEVDLYSDTWLDDAWLWVSDDLLSGEHTLRIRVTGEQNPAASGTTVSIDRVFVKTGLGYSPFVAKQNNFMTTPYPTTTATPSPTVTPIPTSTFTPPPIRTVYPTSTSTPTLIPTTPPPPIVGEIIYDDETVWDNWSWSATVDLANTDPVFTGTQSISVTYDAWGGFSLHRPLPLNTDGFTGLSFYVYGSASNIPLDLYTESSGGPSTHVPITATQDAWSHVEIPLSALGSPAEITRLNIQDQTGITGTVIYLDQIVLLGTPTPLDEVVYDDDTIWHNWSWDAETVLDNTSPVYSGTHSIAITYTAESGGFSLRRPMPLYTSGYENLTFYIYGGVGDTVVEVLTEDWHNQQSNHVIITATEGAWTYFDIPLSDFGNPVEISRLDFQNLGAVAQPVFYMDEIVIHTTPEAPPYTLLYNFETGTESWAGTSGTVAVTSTHVTLGAQALQMNSDGEFFSVTPASVLDFTGMQYLKLDVFSSFNTSLKVALQSGESWQWQETVDMNIHQGITTLWIDLTNAFSGGVPLAFPADVRKINIWLNAGTYVIDFIRLENLPSTPLPSEMILHDFETGDEGWNGPGTVTVTTTHVTHGSQALEVISMGGWFTDTYAVPLDLSGKIYFKFDIFAESSSSVKIVFQSGAGWTWQETADLWIPAGYSTVWVDLTDGFAGNPLSDPTQVHKIGIYFNADTFYVDCVRVE
jgi:hypothetical protein